MTVAASLFSPAEPFCTARLEALFGACFAAAENTVLCGGAAEPFYQPAVAAGEPHRLWYREDFFASALHEIAHWCIAGRERRLLPDFGYWYAPEGRNPAQQAAFERVEVGPQALEWCFAQACGFPFRISTDNLPADEGEVADHTMFKRAVCAEAERRVGAGLGQRAQQFCQALQQAFGNDTPWQSWRFSPADLP